MKDDRTLQERATDLEKVLTFIIVSTIKKYYGDINTLKKVYSKIVSGESTSREQVDFCSRFKCLSVDEYRKILGQSKDANGKWQWIKLADVQKYFTEHLHYQRHFNKYFHKTGKTFSVHGYWYIDFNKVNELLSNDDVFNVKSSFYSKLQRIFIDTLVFKGNYMTKAQKEQYLKEYNEGKHALTLEQYIKEQAKKRRSADKRRMTIAKKAAKETLADYAVLQTKANMLEADNNAKDELIRSQQAEIAELRKLLAGKATQQPTTIQRIDEIPQEWRDCEEPYDYEGPNVQHFRSDGSRLEPKNMPALWMDSNALFEFREGNMDADDFERLWILYTMTDAEKDQAHREAHKQLEEFRNDKRGIFNFDIDNI